MKTRNLILGGVGLAAVGYGIKKLIDLEEESTSVISKDFFQEEESAANSKKAQQDLIDNGVEKLVKALSEIQGPDLK